jgi:hypothetical protein
MLRAQNEIINYNAMGKDLAGKANGLESEARDLEKQANDLKKARDDAQKKATEEGRRV